MQRLPLIDVRKSLYPNGNQTIALQQTDINPRSMAPQKDGALLNKNFYKEINS